MALPPPSKCDNKKCNCKKYCHPIKIIYSVAQTILSVPFYSNQLIIKQDDDRLIFQKSLMTNQVLINKSE